MLPLMVKHPAAAAPGHGSSVTGVPFCCSAVVPISTAVGVAVLVPLTTT